MPIKKETPTRLVKYGETYSVIPSGTIELVADAVALGILVYLMDKPSDWVPRKKDICKSLNIGDDRWRKATAILSELDLFMVTDVRDGNGRFLDRVVTVSAVPMGLSPKWGKPDLGKTQIGKTPPIHITDTTHDREIYKGTSKFRKPTVTEIAEYCKERGNTIDPEGFFDWNESKGWKVGNAPMKDWKAAIRTWEKRDEKTKRSAQPDSNKRRLSAGERTRRAREQAAKRQRGDTG